MAHRAGADIHDVVFLFHCETGRGNFDVFQTLCLFVRPFLFRRFASPQPGFDHDFLAVVTLDGNPARHQVDLYHAWSRRVAERDRHAVRRNLLA